MIIVILKTTHHAMCSDRICSYAEVLHYGRSLRVLDGGSYDCVVFREPYALRPVRPA